jgi:hypothetical protein
MATFTWGNLHEDIYMDTWKHGEMETLGMETSNRKWKPRQFSLFRLLFATCANGSLLFFGLLTKKQTEVIHLQTD